MTRSTTTLAVLLIAFVLSLQPLSASTAFIPAEVAPGASVVLSEIYPDSKEDPEKGATTRHEFIELYNQASESQALEQFVLIRDDDPSAEGDNGLMQLAGEPLQPGEYRAVNPSFSLLNSGTTIELHRIGADGELVIVQSVDYGTETLPGLSSENALHLYENEWHVVSPPTPGQLPPPLPQLAGAEYSDETGGTNTPDEKRPAEEISSPSSDSLDTNDTQPCDFDSVTISEIVANPSGNDAEGGEFIELYNSGETAVSLVGCSLSTDKLEAYEFNETDTIPAKSHKAFNLYDGLLNGGGTVTFTSADYEEAVLYPALGDDEAYALVKGKWQQSEKMTPDALNALPTELEAANAALGLAPCPAGKFRNPSTNRCKSLGSQSGLELKACEPGQFRNPLTNRCKQHVASASGLQPCAPGKVRNPATNRCRSASSASSALEPCKAGQYRNPETNRCKKRGEDDNLKPCKEGSTRNPETNRCRKEYAAAGAGSFSDSGNNGSGSTQNTGQNLALILIAASFLALFVAYEYRLTIRDRLTKVWTRAPQPT